MEIQATRRKTRAAAMMGTGAATSAIASRWHYLNGVRPLSSQFSDPSADPHDAFYSQMLLPYLNTCGALHNLLAVSFFPPSAQSNLHVRTFSSNELTAATNNFNPDHMLGEGGYGPIYRGKIGLQDMAIRRLCCVGAERGSHINGESVRSHAVELKELSHQNIVEVVGCCVEESHYSMVYKFMPCGSLDGRLFGRNADHQPLGWDDRIEIAICVARGLNHLHGRGRAHRNLKCSNILLEPATTGGGGYNVRLTDFGLERRDGYVVRRYPEMGKPTVESDIYGFGLLLMELITGKRRIDGDFHLVEQARPFYEGFDPSNGHLKRTRSYVASPYLEDERCQGLMDPDVRESCFPEDFRTGFYLAAGCLQEDASARPPLGMVISELKRVKLWEGQGW